MFISIKHKVLIMRKERAYLTKTANIHRLLDEWSNTSLMNITTVIIVCVCVPNTFFVSLFIPADFFLKFTLVEVQLVHRYEPGLLDQDCTVFHIP